MSLQKSYVCCKNCSCILAYRVKGAHPLDLMGYIYAARKDAMTALEEAGRAMTPLMDVPNKNIDGLVKTCLDACMRCDFKSPKIAEIIDKALKDPDKETQ